MFDKNEFYTAPVECFFFGFRFPCFPLWVLINFQIPTKYTFCTFNSYTSTLCMIKIYFMYTCVKFNYNYNYIKASKLLFLYVKYHYIILYFFSTYNGCYCAFQYEDSFTPILSHIIKLGSEHRDLFICQVFMNDLFIFYLFITGRKAIKNVFTVSYL